MNEKSLITLILFCAITAFMTGCPREPDQTSSDAKPFSSYREIPGITAQEIDEIEALRQTVSKRENGSFVYGMMLSTEKIGRAHV